MEAIKEYLRVGSCCRKDDKVYFYNLSFNGVFYLDIKDLSIHFLHSFSHESIDAQRLSINGSMIYENVIYFFPNNTDAVMKYNILDLSEEIIPITGLDEKKFGIADFIQWKNMVYLFPGNLRKGIYRLDLQNEKIEKDLELSRLFETDCYCGDIFQTSCDRILLNLYGSNQLIEIDLCKKEIITSKQLGDGIQIYKMCFDGNSFWLLQVESTEIYEWNNENGTLQKYTNEYANQEEQKSMPYVNMIFLEKEILVLNTCTKSIARINKEKKTIENWLEYPEGFRLVNKKYSNWPAYYRYNVLEEYVLIYPQWGNMMLIYNKKDHRVSGKILQISVKEIPDMEEYLKENMLDLDLCREGDDLTTLENYMRIVDVREKENQLPANRNIGQLIYEQC